MEEKKNRLKKSSPIEGKESSATKLIARDFGFGGHE